MGKRRVKIGMEVVNEVQEKTRRISAGAGRSICTVLVYQGELTSGLENEGSLISPFPLLHF